MKDRETRSVCTFCDIAAGDTEASVVWQDDTVLAFMDLHPAVRGHVLVVPRRHAVGLGDLDPSTGAHAFEVGQEMALALRRSGLRCEGVNLLVCDGEAAYQTVFHVHLHVIPRHEGDGWRLGRANGPAAARRRLDADADLIRRALAAPG